MLEELVGARPCGSLEYLPWEISRDVPVPILEDPFLLNVLPMFKVTIVAAAKEERGDRMTLRALKKKASDWNSKDYCEILALVLKD